MGRENGFQRGLSELRILTDYDDTSLGEFTSMKPIELWTGMEKKMNK